ncbi:hypothetical protein PGB90_009924 [Kerria lacca]
MNDKIQKQSFDSCSVSKCHSYNRTACEFDANECQDTIEKCPRNDLKYQCYVLWNATTQDVTFKGCFIESGIDCRGQNICVDKGEPKNNGLLYCCCENNLCNKEFHWKPTPTPLVVPDNVPHKRDYTITYLIPSLDQHPQSPPSPILEKLRSITLIEIKARGKFGAVWKASDKNEIVAVKIMPIQEKQSWLTEQEIYKLPLMNHDSILKFIAAEKHGDNLNTEFWLITAFHELGSLHDFLKSNTVSWEELCYIAYTLARGLTHLHEEIPSEKMECYKPAVAHRDFKSSNVLLKNDLTACIADFGLALIFKPSRSCGDMHGQVGTRRYMAPEILEGAINFSRDSFLRIDMYACGLVLWELVSRCSCQQGSVPDYKLPFEEEVGLHPSLEDIQDVVVHKKMRPVIKNSWKQHPGLAVLCDTIEDLWDHDAEARLSASCVMERTSFQSMSTVSPNTPLMFDSSVANNNVITKVNNNSFSPV